MEEVHSNPPEDLEGFNISVLEATADVKETAGKLKLEVESEAVPESLQSHDKASTGKELLLMDEQRKRWLEMETAPGEEEAVHIDEMTARDLEQCKVS